MRARTPDFVSHQGGAVLFVALVFLVLITLLGLTASSTSILQERMTGGLRNGQLGLMGAETAARGAEAWLWNLSSNSGHINCGYNGGDVGFCYAPQTADNGSGGTTYVSNPLVSTFRTSPSWITNSSSGGTNYTNGSSAALNASTLGTAALAQVPQYMLESRGIVLPPGASPNGNGGRRDPNLGRCPGCQTMYSYRITARATGGNDSSVSVVEVTFGAGVPSN
jgi:type IV pilus assembly protein PilX